MRRLASAVLASARWSSDGPTPTRGGQGVRTARSRWWSRPAPRSSSTGIRASTATARRRTESRRGSASTARASRRPLEASDLEGLVRGHFIKTFHLSVPVDQLSSGEKGLDANMRKALKGDRYKQIRFQMDSYEVVGPPGTAALTVVLHGRLSLAGVERKIDVTAAGVRVRRRPRDQRQQGPPDDRLPDQTAHDDARGNQDQEPHHREVQRDVGEREDVVRLKVAAADGGRAQRGAGPAGLRRDRGRHDRRRGDRLRRDGAAARASRSTSTTPTRTTIGSTCS